MSFGYWQETAETKCVLLMEMKVSVPGWEGVEVSGAQMNVNSWELIAKTIYCNVSEVVKWSFEFHDQ